MPRLRIEYQCPQCGAPAVLEETDRLFVCKYCRVRSYLLPKDVFRYMLPSSAPKSKRLVFFPYWRFKGMLFSCAESGIKHRFIDVSHQAVASPYYPISVGLRSQALVLRFVTPETPGYFLKPTLPLKSMVDTFSQRFSRSLPDPVFHQSHIGETISMIYSPFYANDKIYDAVLNSPLGAKLPDDFDAMVFPGGRPDWRIQFTPALCPACGWDLDGKRNAWVLTCNNCNSAWRPAGNRLKSLKFAFIPAKEEHVLYLPFWRIKADIPGIELHTYADLAKIANLPKAVQKNWQDIEFHFWSPAFKVRPQVFLRLSRNLTLSQYHDKLVETLPDGPLYPVTLPVREAIQSLTISLANFAKPQKEFVHNLRNLAISPKSYLLVYIPFTEKHLEYIQSQLKLTLNKNQLALAANL